MMPRRCVGRMLDPFDWNVVVAGAWNRALLTPAWLQRRLFEQPDALVEVFLPVEWSGPPRVKLGNIAVSVQGGALAGALVVEAMDGTYATLGRALALADRALELLPETPVGAVGINVRYRLGPLPARAVERTRATLDHQLSDADFQIMSRQLHRSLAFGAGLLNVILAEDNQGSGEVVFNFHLDLGRNDVDAVHAWLRQRTEVLKNAVDRILSNCIGIELSRNGAQ